MPINERTINTIINWDSYCKPTVRITSNNDEIKNEILGLKNIAEIITTPGIGKTYGEKPVGKTTAKKHVNAISIAVKDKYLGSKKLFSNTLK